MRIFKLKREKPLVIEDNVQEHTVFRPAKKTFSDHFSKELFAERLRMFPTRSEAIVRDALMSRGHKFQFQPLLHGYIPDFYFPKQNKIVELDGKCHENQRAYDARRTQHLKMHGCKLIRIKSQLAFTNLPKVIAQIENFAFGIPMKKTKRHKKRDRDRRNRSHARPTREQRAECPFDLSTADPRDQFRHFTEGL